MGQQSVSSPTSGNSKGFGSTNPSTSGQAQFGMPNPSAGKGSPTFQGNSQKPTESGGVATTGAMKNYGNPSYDPNTPQAVQTTQRMATSADLNSPAALQGFSGKGGSSPPPAQQPAAPATPISTNIKDYGPGSQFYQLEAGVDPNGIQTYKGMIDEQHPDGVYQSTNDEIARQRAMSTASQQGFSGVGQPAQQPSSGKGGGKYR